jgi:hypothetical protein
MRESAINMTLLEKMLLRGFTEATGIFRQSLRWSKPADA